MIQIFIYSVNAHILSERLICDKCLIIWEKPACSATTVIYGKYPLNWQRPSVWQKHLRTLSESLQRKSSGLRSERSVGRLYDPNRDPVAKVCEQTSNSFNI